MRKLIIFPLLATFGVIFFGFSQAPKAWKVKTEEATVSWELPSEPRPEGGSIGDVQAEVVFDPDQMENSHIVASVATETFTSSNAIKTKHLKEAKKYLNVDDFPRIEFTSEKFVQGEDLIEAWGKVDFKGKSIPVTLFFTFEAIEEGGVFKGYWEMNTEAMGIEQGFKSLKEGQVENNLRIEFTLPVES